MEGKKLVDRIVELAEDKKGENISILDLKGLNYIADYFVIISGDSSPHCEAIADNIERELRLEGVWATHREQDRGSNWSLLDYSDVVVHVFEQTTREFYALERLWGDALFLKEKVKKNAGKSKAKPKKRAKKSRK